MVLPTEVKFNFCMRLIKLSFAFLCKNLIFLLSFDKVTNFSKYNFFSLYICLMGNASKNSFPIKITGPQFISFIFFIHLTFVYVLLNYYLLFYVKTLLFYYRLIKQHTFQKIIFSFYKTV